MDDFNVAEGIDLIVDMDNVAILKNPYDMDNSIDFADVGQKFIAQTFAFRSALDQTGNIDKFDDGRNGLGRVRHFC